MQCFSICGPWPIGGPQSILQWATQHFGKSRILKKSCLNFFFSWRSPVFGRKNRLNFGEDLFFLEITCFRPKKPLHSTSKLIWPENLGQVLEQYFESGAMENFQNQNGPRLGNGWEPLNFVGTIK